MRYVLGFVAVLALGVMHCSETSGTGGEGGGGGGVTDCTGVEDLTECKVGDNEGMCLEEACRILNCADIEDGTDCLLFNPLGAAPGLCVAGACEWLTRCEEDSDCNHDGNDCTTETCLSNGLCEEGGAVPDGTPCAGGTCLAGMCDLTGSVLPCNEQGIRNAIAAGGGPYTLDCDEPTTVVLRATIGVDNDVILDGGGVTLDARNTADTTFRVEGEVTVELNGFTLIGGDHAGLYNAGNLTLANSTATENPGWGLDNDGVLTVINSTVSGNTGAAQIFNQGSVALINSTLLAEVSSAALSTSLSEVTAIEGCVIRGSCALAEQPLTSNGYNIESPGDTCGFDQTGDLVNITEAQLDLGELAHNGGPTTTHALGGDSVAIDHIPAVDCEVDEDQRGEPRPVGDGCDVGSFERQPEDP